MYTGWCWESCTLRGEPRRTNGYGESGGESVCSERTQALSTCSLGSGLTAARLFHTFHTKQMDNKCKFCCVIRPDQYFLIEGNFTAWSEDKALLIREKHRL